MLDMTIVQKIAIWALPLIFAITLHEVAHGWVASWFGDNTAKLSGRLSLNPLHHIDWVGTVIVPLLMLMVSNFIFGWAKPVPVDGRNMRRPKLGLAMVALAGPAANILMAFFWGFIAWLGVWAESAGNGWFGVPLSYMGGAGIMINAVLAILNLLPLPPLDGGAFLANVLPPRVAYRLTLIEPYSFFILIILIFTGALSFILVPPVYFVIGLVSRVFGLG